ncbi:MAG: hypothetical protein KDK39_03035 [Leptospiraceae bacterium]|nr:hypothetical protein [Leptospiraceae bacterium]
MAALLLPLQHGSGQAQSRPGRVPIPRVAGWDQSVFQPDLNSAEYIEAWSFRHDQPDLYLSITFLISNLGPGQLNNGLAVLIYQGGQSHIITAEYSDHSLTARPGDFGIKSGRSYFRSCGSDCLDVAIRLDQIHLDLQLSQILRGPDMDHPDLPLNAALRNNMQASIPIGRARSVGQIRWQRQELQLAGIGGLEYIHTHRSPHRYVKRIHLLRSLRGPEFYAGFLEPVSAKHTGAAAPGFGISFGPLLPGMQLPQAAPGSLSASHSRGLLQVPELRLELPQVYYFTSVPYSSPGSDTSAVGECRLAVTRQVYRGGMTVFGHISAVLRWVLQLLFANPVIVHFQATADWQCRADKRSPWRTRQRFTDVLFTSYILDAEL